MRKKWVSLLVCLVLLGTAAAAHAAAPSKTTQDLVQVVSVVTANESEQDALIYLLDQYSDNAVTQLQQIGALVSAGTPAIQFYPEAVRAQIAALLPPGTDPVVLSLNDMISVGVGLYEVTDGDVTVTFTFATQYQPGQAVVAVFSYLDATGAVAWWAIKAEVADGNLRVTLPAKLMLMIGHAVDIGVLAD